MKSSLEGGKRRDCKEEEWEEKEEGELAISQAPGMVYVYIPACICIHVNAGLFHLMHFSLFLFHTAN